MTGRRASLSELPFWPRLLGREEAARYVGVSPSVFDAECRAGLWPPAMQRGERGGRLTWDRRALDRAADRAAHLESPAEAPQPAPQETQQYWLDQLKASFAKKDAPDAKKPQKRPASTNTGG